MTDETKTYASFEDYFASELKEADKARAEELGEGYKDTRKVWDADELLAMRDPRTGKPFNIIGLNVTTKDYIGNYISCMNVRVNNPFLFWNKYMHEDMPVQEVDFLTTIGVFVDKMVDTNKVESQKDGE